MSRPPWSVRGLGWSWESWGSSSVPAMRRFEADFRPLSSCRDAQPALNCSCRSDRVTRDGPVALRVHVAQTETRNKGFGLDGPLDMMVQREPGAPRASDVDIAVARPPAVPRASESAPAASHSAGLRAPESAMRPSIHSGQIARVPPGGAESPGGEPGLGQQLRPPPAGAC